MEGPVWFRPKRYGIGAGLPIAWQGWVLTAIYLAAIFGAAMLLQYRWQALLATVIPTTLLFMLICAKTTEGGWRWRWGSDD